jgi:peptidoglycan/LPS O-acetylase OafA/YrhL
VRYKNAWLDIVRSTAILLVLLSHSRGFLLNEYPAVNALKFGGFMGVELFFVLSGFLIGKILWKLSENYNFRNVKNFYMRRWLRTIPNYYFFLLLAIVASLSGIRPDPITDVVRYFLFIQNISSSHPPFFGEAWSLSVEEFFYFSFPLFAAAVVLLLKIGAKKAMFLVGVTIIIASTIARIYLANNFGIDWDADIRKVVLFRLDAIMIGVVSVFFINEYNWDPVKRFITIPLFLCFVFCCVYVAMASPEALNQSFFAKSLLFNFASLGCLGFLFIGYKLNFTSKIIVLGRFFSKISYSLYLSNLLVIYLINYYFGNFPSLIKWLSFFPLVVIVSFVAYQFVEKPFLAFRSNKFKETY